MKDTRKCIDAVLASAALLTLMVGAPLLVFSLQGCSVIGSEPVAGWPKLRVIEHHVPHAEMRARCAKYVGFGMSPEACAEFDLAHGTCHIWYSADVRPDPYIVKHERLHCEGYDHIGSTSMRDFLARWMGQ